MSIYISIIVPVYNVEQYLKKCLNSLWQQNIPESKFEVIVVNDGSTDGSPTIAQDLLSKHKNGYYLTQPNRGLSEARNAGLKVARGEYVWFVDSDDWISSNCFEEMLRAVDGQDALAFGAVSHMPTGERVISIGKACVLSGPEYMCRFRDKLEACVPFFLFKRSFLLNNCLSFVPGLFHEDSEFTPRAILRASRIVISSNAYYHRLVRPDSIMRTISPKRSADILKGMSNVYQFYQRQNSLSCAVIRSVNDFISNNLNYACKLSRQTDLEDKKAFRLKLADEKWLSNVLLNSSRVKYKVEGLLLLLFPGHLPEIHRFLMLFNIKHWTS